jgi:hypothetical protein
VLRRSALAAGAAASVLLWACEQRSAPESPAIPAASAPADADVADAYLYLLGRVVMLRQQRIDFEQRGFRWNEISSGDPAEAWVAVDERTCVQLDVPEASDASYSTWQMLNGWGETVLNVNERTFPERPHGRFALCLHGSAAPVPEGALRVDLVSRTARAIGRGRDYRLTALGEAKIDPSIPVSVFANDALPKSEIFERAAEILAGEPDTNEGMDGVRAKVGAVEAFARAAPQNRAALDRAIEARAWPELEARMERPGPSGNGWMRPARQGHYGSDFIARTVANLAGPGLNTAAEVTPFAAVDLDGSAFYLLQLPSASWSLSLDGRVVLDARAKLAGPLAFAPELPPNVAKSRWIETPAGRTYALTLRFHAPPPEISAEAYFPPPLFPQPWSPPAR